MNHLSILDDFKIGDLPLQIRMSPEKFQYIRRVLDNNASAYKEVGKLLKLSRLLRTEKEVCIIYVY